MHFSPFLNPVFNKLQCLKAGVLLVSPSSSIPRMLYGGVEFCLMLVKPTQGLDQRQCVLTEVWNHVMSHKMTPGPSQVDYVLLVSTAHPPQVGALPEMWSSGSRAEWKLGKQTAASNFLKCWEGLRRPQVEASISSPPHCWHKGRKTLEMCGHAREPRAPHSDAWRQPKAIRR